MSKCSYVSCRTEALGPLLFNIYLNDLFMFLEETEVCNYADDITIYVCGPNVENVIAKLENDAFKISEWFPNNLMKLNEDKCHLMIFASKSNEVSVKIGDASVKQSKEEKLLGITFHWTISFKQVLCQNYLQKSQPKTSCTCQNILLPAQGKAKAGNASICLVSF